MSAEHEAQLFPVEDFLKDVLVQIDQFRAMVATRLSALQAASNPKVQAAVDDYKKRKANGQVRLDSPDFLERRLEVLERQRPGAGS